MDQRPRLTVAVRMERRRQPNQWEDWGFRVAEVVLDEGGFGTEPRLLRDDGDTAQWLYPGLQVALYRDEAEGYYLNLSSGQAVWFVTWRLDERPDATDPPVPRPEIVTVSYHEAGRWLDAQERVDNLPMPDEVRAGLQAYVDEHYRPEPKRRARPASFRNPEQR
ncbi:MAG: DUF3305 domain-containing protein [Rubrivivax sp.]|nr:DUF3305 domain-containing protein [Rubrivivax sp.]